MVYSTGFFYAAAARAKSKQALDNCESKYYPLYCFYVQYIGCTVVSDALENLLSQHRHIWRGRGARSAHGNGWATGFQALDALLPEQGWPRDTLVEMVVSAWGIGELQLLMPAMVKAMDNSAWLAWIAPPYIPYAPALAGSGLRLDRLVLVQPSRSEDIPWAMEKLLRQRRCAMVLAWPGKLKPVMVRRLQLAAEAGQTLGVLLYDKDQGSSPAALRLRLSPAGRKEEIPSLQVTMLKSRSACRRQSVLLPLV